jgi:hypothetical protein
LYELLVLSVGEKDIGAIDGKRVFKPREVLVVVFVFHRKIGGDASQGGHNLSQRRISHCIYNYAYF